jgi:Flp pilus assembly pilin Flp
MKSQNQSRASGQGLVEYVLIAVLITIGIILAMQLMGVSISDAYCFIANAIPGADACSQSEFCSDDFASNLNNWNTPNGTVSLNNGQMCTSGTSMTFNNCSMNSDETDYVINLDGASLKSGQGYGVFFRASNTEPDRYGYVHQNGYSFQYDPGSGGFVFEKWVKGNHIYPPLAVVKAKNYNWYNQPKDVKVVVKGDTFSAYVDGVLVLTAKDSSYSQGGTGLRSWDSSETCFDSFGIEKVP